jgi:hypothetical protein
MPTKDNTPTLVVNIERQYFANILAIPQRKSIEYRDITEYWTRRIERVGKPPFNLRLLNGMTPPVPEATVRVTKVVENWLKGRYELHLGEILEVKHWDREKEFPLE